MHPSHSAVRNRARGLATLAAGLACLALAACGRSAPLPGITHLDPRLADGRASADALAANRTELQRFAAGGGAVDGWRIASGKALEGPYPCALEPVGGAPLALEHLVDPARPLSTARFNAVELRVLVAAPGRATLRWRRRPTAGAAAPAAPAPPWPEGQSVQVAFAASIEPQIIGFDLALHAQWSGELDALRIEPDQGGGQRVAVESIALVERGWGFAPERLDAERGAEREGGDGGLIQLDLDARRAWPAAFEQELFARCTVPPRGKLCVDTATVPALRGSLERVQFEVELKTADGPWSRIALRKIFPKEKPGETLWRPWTVDLSPWSGAEVELKLRARDASPQTAAASGAAGDATAPVPAESSAVARVLWGAPIVLGEPDDERLPNLVLVTLDTTRADHIGERTPYLAELARRGVEFTQAFAPSNATQPSHATILTGTWVGDHGVTSNLCALGDANRTLAELLRARGYFTAAAVSQPFLGPGSGFGQGFDVFLQAAPQAPFDGSSTVFRVRQLFELWEKDQGERPFFLWLHLFDPHTPYGPPSDYAKFYAERWKSPQPDATQPATLPELDVLPPEMRFLEGVRNAELPRWWHAVEVAHADALVENLASNLAERGWLGRTAWVIAADHGESLGERDSWFNHAGLFPEVTHVPLILNLPGGPEGERVDVPVSTVDIAPTVCAWLGLDANGMRGIDLAALADGGDAPARRLLMEASDGEMAGWLDAENYYVEVTHPQARFGLEIVHDAQGRRVASNKALKPGSAWLYDRASDATCRTNLADAQAQRRENCKAELAKLRAALRGGATIERAMDEAQLEQMRKLGYAGK